MATLSRPAMAAWRKLPSNSPKSPTFDGFASHPPAHRDSPAVNDELLAWLRGTRLATFMVVHCNHPAEIDAEVAAAFGRLVEISRRAGP